MVHSVLVGIMEVSVVQDEQEDQAAIYILEV